MRIVETRGANRSSCSQEDTWRLDRSKWHRPLVSIIVTHYNYSAHLKEALLSLLDQSQDNWECVVVDDGSEQLHQSAVQAIVDDIGSAKIRALLLPENVGQTSAFFAGLDATRGAFVCLLDPDDRYAEDFLAESVAAHLNQVIFCPLVCCDQQLMQNGALISGVYSQHKSRMIAEEHGVRKVPAAPIEELLYFPPTAKGWIWTASSAMMFRRGR